MTEPENPTQPERTERDVQYKGAPLDSAKGPGLGCFWTQVVALAIVIVLTPLSAVWNWPTIVSIVLLATLLVLLLLVGQTSIFLMRLVAADRRAAGPRRPMQSRTKTVGEIEAEGGGRESETSSAEERHVVDDGPGGSGVRE
ncbi:MAG TPA: hypothetical protein VKR30_05870 [Candidatus Limnocylindrales bacterium]|nr:hypothetical protein [Candidatus Limnocylindrales bacterium]